MLLFTLFYRYYHYYSGNIFHCINWPLIECASQCTEMGFIVLVVASAFDVYIFLMGLRINVFFFTYTISASHAFAIHQCLCHIESFRMILTSLMKTQSILIGINETEFLTVLPIPQT